MVVKIARQFLVILIFAFIGEVLNYFIPLPIPACIYGIVLLFLALEFKIVKVSQVKQISQYLIAVMPIMFLPAAVGLIDVWSIVKESWLAYSVITFFSTLIVMGITAVVTQFVIRKTRNN